MLTKDELLTLKLSIEEAIAAVDASGGFPGNPIGDGRAVFLSDMNDDEVERYEYEITHGWQGFINKIKKL